MKRTPDDVLMNFLTDGGEDPGGVRREKPLLQEGDRQPEGVCSQGRAVPSVVVPAYDLAGNFYWKDKVYLDK